MTALDLDALERRAAIGGAATTELAAIVKIIRAAVALDRTRWLDEDSQEVDLRDALREAGL